MFDNKRLNEQTALVKRFMVRILVCQIVFENTNYMDPLYKETSYLESDRSQYIAHVRHSEKTADFQRPLFYHCAPLRANITWLSGAASLLSCRSMDEKRNGEVVHTGKYTICVSDFHKESVRARRECQFLQNAIWQSVFLELHGREIWLDSWIQVKKW